MFHVHRVYTSLYLDRCWYKVPWRSQEIYVAKKNIALFSEQYAVRLIQVPNMKQRNSFTYNGK